MHDKNNDESLNREHLEPRKTVSGKIAATAVLCSSLALGGMQAIADTEDVKVFFNGDCPTAVDKPFFEMTKKKIKWTAYDNSDDPKPKPDQEFDIYFDPFVGPNPSYHKGSVTSPNIKNGLPPGITYKYTVVGKGCDIGLDPFFRVQ